MENRDPVTFRIGTTNPLAAKMDVDVSKGADFWMEMCHRLPENIDCSSKPSLMNHVFHIEGDLYKFNKCFLLNLLHVAVPSWKRIYSNEPVATHVFCQIAKMINANSLKSYPNFTSCLHGNILKNNTCYHLYDTTNSGIYMSYLFLCDK